MVPRQGAPEEYEVFFVLHHGRVLVASARPAGVDRREAVGVGGDDRSRARVEETGINSASHVRRVAGRATHRQGGSVAHCTVAQFGDVHALADRLPNPRPNRQAVAEP